MADIFFDGATCDLHITLQGDIMLGSYSMPGVTIRNAHALYSRLYAELMTTHSRPRGYDPTEEIYPRANDKQNP